PAGPGALPPVPFLPIVHVRIPLCRQDVQKSLFLSYSIFQKSAIWIFLRKSYVWIRGSKKGGRLPGQAPLYGMPKLYTLNSPVNTSVAGPHISTWPSSSSQEICRVPPSSRTLACGSAYPASAAATAAAQAPVPQAIVSP